MGMKFDPIALVEKYEKRQEALLRGPQPEKRSPGVSLAVIGIDETAKVLGELSKLIKVNTARVVANIMADLLARSAPRVPWDTKQLRGSGRAVLLFGSTYITVAKVNKEDASVEVTHTRLPKSGLKSARKIDGDIYYNRENEEGQDIALWAHEDLNPYGSGHRPQARKPGTGPKYLENPWNEAKDEYIAYAKEELAGSGFDSLLSKVLHKRSKKRKGFVLNYVDLVFDVDSVYRGEI